MSDIERTENADAACCVNAGCGIRFDPACEGFNGECDRCAAVAADHFAGAHHGLETECGFCWAEGPVDAEQPLAFAA